MNTAALLLPVVSLCLTMAAPAATIAYRNLILGDKPIVYYEFDETSGTTAANSATTGATYTGTFNTTGGSITVGHASFAQGGTAYNFGGGFIGAASALTNSLTEWTVEAWVYYDSVKVALVWKHMPCRQCPARRSLQLTPSVTSCSKNSGEF